MKRQVVFTDKEWDKFRQEVARQIHAHARERYGFTVSSRDTGIEITERLEDWFMGVVALAFGAAEATAGK